MTSAEIIAFARVLGKNVPESLVTQENMLIMLNNSYNDLYDRIVALDRNYFWDRWTGDTVANQYEYTIKQPTEGILGMYKPEKLRIKYTSTSEYVDIEFKDWDSLIETPEFYAENQSVDSPFAVITDNTYIHIFPTPIEAVTNGLIFEGAKKPYDLILSSVNTDILIDKRYHKTISYMMLPAINFAKGYVDEKNDAVNQSEIEIKKALKSMGLLTTKVVRAKIADLSGLE